MRYKVSLEVIEIKNTNIGPILLLSSAIIYGSVLISASSYSSTLSGVGGQGWDTRYGVFGTALREVGTIPLIIATVSVIAGVIIMVFQDKKA